MASKRFTNPFPPLRLKAEDAAQLQVVAQAVVRDTMEQFECFAFDRRYKVDERRWKLVLERDNIRAFGERRGLPNEHLLPDAPVTDMEDLPVVLLVGTIEGTLHDALYGDLCSTHESVRLKTAYVGDEVVGSAVLATLVHPTAADPFRAVTIRWFEKGRPPHVRAVVKNRDFVFIESTGFVELSTGERVGHHLIHSVQFPETPPLDRAIRGNLSFCAIFKQRLDDANADAVDVYMRGVMNPAGGLMRSIVIKSAATGLVSATKYMYCAERKKLAWLVRRRRATSKAHIALLEPDGSVETGRAASGRTASCPFCGKPPSTLATLRAKARPTCQVCCTQLCSACKLKRKLFFLAADGQLVGVEMLFCNLCVTEAAELDALEVARDELVRADTATWSDGYAQSSASSSSGAEFSPSSSAIGAHQHF